MSPFELSLSVPAEPRYAATLALVAVRAAQQVGCDGATVTTLGTVIEQALRDCFSGAPPQEKVDIGLEMRTGDAGLEVVVACGRRVRIARTVPIGG